MPGIEIADVLELATNSDNPQARLEQLYQWRYDHLATAAKAVIGGGFALLVAVTAALFGHKTGTSYDPFAIGGGASAVLTVIGAWRFRQVERIYKEYMAAHQLLERSLPIAKFLALARRP